MEAICMAIERFGMAAVIVAAVLFFLSRGEFVFRYPARDRRRQPEAPPRGAVGEEPVH